MKTSRQITAEIEARNAAVESHRHNSELELQAALAADAAVKSAIAAPGAQAKAAATAASLQHAADFKAWAAVNGPYPHLIDE